MASLKSIARTSGVAVPSGALPRKGLCEPGSVMEGAFGGVDVDCDSKRWAENMANIRLRVTKAETFNAHRILDFSDVAAKAKGKAGV